MKVVLYQSDDGYSMFLDGRKPSGYSLGKNTVLLATFDAETWEDARRKMAELLGWEYKPFEPDLSIPGNVR